MAKVEVKNTQSNLTVGKNEVHVMTGGVVNTLTCNNSSGKLLVYGGGVVNNAKISAEMARVSVYQGGIVSGMEIRADQTYVNISSGGKAEKTTISNNGSMFVYSSGSALKSDITSGSLKIYAGGIASDITLHKSGYAEVDGGRADKIEVNAAGHLNVSNGGYVTNATVNQSGWLKLHAGSSVDAVVNSGGKILLERDASYAQNTTISGGAMQLSAGKASATTVVGGRINVSGGFAEDTVISSGGMMRVIKGAAETAEIHSSGMVEVSGGTLSNAVVSSGGEMVMTKGVIADAAVSSGGKISVSGGKIADSVITSGGSMFLSGGTLDDLDVKSGAIINGMEFFQSNDDLDSADFAGAKISACDAVIYAGQSLTGGTVCANTLSVYGTAADTVVQGGEVILEAGAKHTGTLTVDAGATFFASEGSTLDFSIAGRTEASDFIVNDLTLITGLPDFSITVKNNQDYGVYKLAQGAYYFNSTVTMTNGDYVFGTLELGSFKAHNGDDAYSLFLDDDGNLMLNVAYEDRTPPVKPVATASTTKPTNKSVTITATFSEDSYIREYSFDNENWYDYSGAIVMNLNGTVYFRAIDDSGNISEVTAYKVSNIDLTAPAKPTVKASSTALVKGNVTVTASFSKDSTVKQYSTDNKTWKTYSKGIVMKKNGTLYFRAADAAGNYSAVTSYKVTNIYTPVAKAISGVKTKTSKNSITLTWSKVTPAKGDKVTYQIREVGDDDTWTVKSPKFTEKGLDVNETHKYQIRTVVTAPNMTVYSEWKTVSVFLKDITKPKVNKLTATVSGYSATIKIDGSDDDDIKKFVVTYGNKSVTVNTKYEIEKDGEYDYEDDAVVKLTGLPVGKVAVSVVAYDVAGNKSSAKKINLTIKDVTPPSKVTTLKAPTVTNKYKGTFSWSAATDNSGKIASYEIQLDNGKIYKSTKTTLSVSNLSVGKHTYRVRAIDKAKNVGAWSDKKSFTVKDMTAPSNVSVSAKVSGNNATLTWKKPKDNVGVTKYVLKYGNKTVTLSGSTTKYVISGLDKGTYSYSMVAYDAAGNASKAKTGKITIKQALAPEAASAALCEASFAPEYEASFAPEADILAYCNDLNDSANLSDAASALTADKKNDYSLLA